MKCLKYWLQIYDIFSELPKLYTKYSLKFYVNVFCDTFLLPFDYNFVTLWLEYAYF